VVRRQVSVVFCDVCGEPDAMRWGITTPEGSRVSIDLCPKHGQVLENLTKSGMPKYRRGVEVVDPRELKKAVRVAKKAPSGRSGAGPGTNRPSDG